MLDALSTDMVHAVSDPSSPGRCVRSTAEQEAGKKPGIQGALRSWRADSRHWHPRPDQLSGHGRACRKEVPSPNLRSLPLSGGHLFSRFSCNAINPGRMLPSGTGPRPWDFPRFHQAGVGVGAGGGEGMGGPWSRGLPALESHFRATDWILNTLN